MNTGNCFEIELSPLKLIAWTFSLTLLLYLVAYRILEYGRGNQLDDNCEVWKEMTKSINLTCIIIDR